MAKPKKILSIIASPNNPSLSSAANIKVAELLRKKYPNSEFTLVDLNNTPFANNSLTVQSKPTFWTETESDYWIDKLKETDILIISTPMINFNYSGALKNFIDSICVADKSFTYKYVTKGASRGLIDKLRVIIVATQGAPKGWYLFGDHVRNLKGTFRFLGAKKVNSLLIDGTKVAPKNKMSLNDILAELEGEIEELVEKY